MNNLGLRRTFLIFHLTLGIVIFVESVRAVLLASHSHTSNPLGSHFVLFAGIEAVAAILFLVPRTLKIGSWLLLVIFVVAIVVHGVAQELALLVYGAGVAFVYMHGSVFSKELFISRREAM